MFMKNRYKQMYIYYKYVGVNVNKSNYCIKANKSCNTKENIEFVRLIKITTIFKHPAFSLSIPKNIEKNNSKIIVSIEIFHAPDTGSKLIQASQIFLTWWMNFRCFDLSNIRHLKMASVMDYLFYCQISSFFGTTTLRKQFYFCSFLQT